MIYCPNCGTSNRKGSRFCNECGEPLPSTGMRCPMCDTINAVGNVYCQACNARLVPMSAPPEETPEEEASGPIKGVSLPTIPLDEEDSDEGDRDVEKSSWQASGEEPPATPSWLAELRESAEDVPDEAGDEGLESSEPFTSTDIPDWLSEMGPIGEETAPAPTSEPPSIEESRELTERADVPPPEPGDIPDWIRELGPVTEQEGPLAGEGESLAEPTDEDVGPSKASTTEADLDEPPDWLRDVLESGTEMGREPEPEGAGQGRGPVEDETVIEIPEWLKEGGTGTPPPPPKTRAEQEPPPEEPPDHEEARPEEEPSSDIPLEAIAIPSWLAEARGGAAGPPSDEPPPPFTETPPEDVETPDWLSELMTAGTVEDEQEEDVPPFADETEVPEPEGETGLKRADIPSWLQELRPGRPGAGRVAAGPLETEGLLKGLRDVIPSADLVAEPGTLDVVGTGEPDEASLARAELLQSLLGQPALTPRERTRKETTDTSSLIERLLVAAILVAAVVGVLLAPLFVGRGPHLTQPLATAGADRLHELIEDLDSGEPVLLAFDYGPPAADELNAAARPVVRHLLDRGASLSIVSTRPDGLMVAEDMLTGLASSDEQVTVMGYRPGAAMAASQLLGATEQTPSLLVVLSGQPFPLLLWIEQAEAAYGDRLPVAAVGSAALEPIAGPYLDAEALQLSGAVFGYQGGSAYEAVLGSTGDATRRLDALAAGHLAIILTMIGGAFVHALRGRGEGMT